MDATQQHSSPSGQTTHIKVVTQGEDPLMFFLDGIVNINHKSNQSAWKEMYNRLTLYLSFLEVSGAFLSDWSPYSAYVCFSLVQGLHLSGVRWRLNPEDRGNIFL
jgi:hypothetical protein